MREQCWICTPGDEHQEVCRKCFMIWYDAGITNPAVLAREARWRRENGRWPFGDDWRVTQDEFKALESMPLPDLIAEERQPTATG